MDIETIVINNQIIPYLICAFDGVNYIQSFGLNQEVLFAKFIKGLLTFFKGRSKILTVYAHNLSGFDGIFLLNHLIKFGTVEPLLFNGKLITIKIKLDIEGEHYGKTIIFKDSYLILPNSLRKLAIIFKTTEVKGVFPFKLKNISYNGAFPRLNTFINLTLNEYLSIKQEYKHKTWNFKTEALKYCKLDCLILFEILTQFNELVFNQFTINIDKVLTLPALSMRIFKTHFMPEKTVYQIHGKVANNIRESYSGGAVDVFIPHNKIGTYSISNVFRKLWSYDVNSLYPFVMYTKPMPIGLPTAFEGDITKVDSNAYGFFYCKITSPSFLEHPILQRIIKTSEGIRTIAGLGTWIGWIYSEEMYNAIKYGYSFEIIKGYTFEKGELFKSFIDKLYNLRLEYPKGHPMNQIAKLIMNSLYGKFGMRDEITKMEIYNSLTVEDQAILSSVLDLYDSTITDILELENHTLIVRNSLTDLTYNEKEDFFHGPEVNVAIASAVTAEARIHMSQFKNNPKFHLYYSDTDSIVIDSPLPDSMIGSALGLMKLEHIIDKAVFLAPKVYALITDSGQEIVKVKGLKHDAISKLHFSDLETLLIQDSTREFTQEKWFKSITKGTINTSDVIYTLKATSNKRQAVYIDGIYENTTPYFYNQIELVNNIYLPPVINGGFHNLFLFKILLMR
jgi:hypothetical protein